MEVMSPSQEGEDEEAEEKEEEEKEEEVTKGGSAPCFFLRATTRLVERKRGKLGMEREREMSALPSASFSTNEG